MSSRAFRYLVLKLPALCVVAAAALALSACGPADRTSQPADLTRAPAAAQTALPETPVPEIADTPTLQPSVTVSPASETATALPSYTVARVANLPAHTPTAQPTEIVSVEDASRLDYFVFTGPRSALAVKWGELDENYALVPGSFRVLRSVDRLQTWQDVTPPGLQSGGEAETMSASLTGVLDDQTFWVAAHPQDPFAGTDLLYRTTDGGQTWTTIEAPFAMGSIDMLDEHNAWVVSSAGGCGAGSCWVQLYYTADGGASWTLYQPQPPLEAEEGGGGTFRIRTGSSFRFASPETLWHAGAWVDDRPPELLVSRDRGQTWQNAPIDLPGGLRPVYVQAPAFLNEREGFFTLAVSPDIEPLPDGSDRRMVAIYATADGGQSWSLRPLLDAGDWTGTVQFATAADWFATCNGALCRTRDGGQTWDALPLPAVTGAYAFTIYRFFDSQNGFGAARFTTQDYQDYQELYATSDGGQTWEKLEPVRIEND